MSGRSWLVLVMILGAGALVWFLRGDRGARADGVVGPAPRIEGALTPAPAKDTSATEVTDVPSGERTVAADPDPELPESAPRGASKLLDILKPYEVAGRALDPSGAPVPEVELFESNRPNDALARTLVDGSFRFETRKQHLDLEGRREGWATVRAGIVDRERAEREVRVVLAPAVAMAGRVLDPEGRALEGARLAVTQGWLGMVGFPLPLDDSEPRNVETTSDAEGRFALEAVPRVPGRPLRVTSEGFVPAELEVPQFAARDLEVRLERGTEQETTGGPLVFGVVRFPDGAPVEGARVQILQEHTTSDRDGRFELARPQWLQERMPLVAMLDGWQPALFEELPRLLEDEAARVGPIELTLPGRALSIRGKLELADGSPAKKWSVRLVDPTVLDDTQTPAPTLEDGGESASQGRTDQQGRFELEGLSEREYTIRLWNPKTYVSVESAPVAAGTEDLTLRVPEGAVLPELTGRVTTRGAVPLEGAEVSLQFITLRSRTGFSWETPASTRTDADGHFMLRDVPRQRVNVVVSGTEVVTKTYEPDGGELDGEPIELEVERLLRVRLDFSGEDSPPSTFQLLDPAGDALMIESRGAHGSSSSTEGQLEEGRSAVVAVSEAAVTLVLMRDYAEYERRPVVLTPGEVNELRP